MVLELVVGSYRTSLKISNVATAKISERVRSSIPSFRSAQLQITRRMSTAQPPNVGRIRTHQG